MAELQVVEEKLTSEYNDMFRRNEDYKNEVTKMQRDAIKLDRKSEVLQVEIDELLNMLEPDQKDQQKKKYG